MIECTALLAQKQTQCSENFQKHTPSHFLAAVRQFSSSSLSTPVPFFPPFMAADRNGTHPNALSIASVDGARTINCTKWFRRPLFLPHSKTKQEEIFSHPGHFLFFICTPDQHETTHHLSLSTKHMSRLHSLFVPNTASCLKLLNLNP